MIDTDTIDPIASYYHEDVGKHYRPLSPKEEKSVLGYLYIARENAKEILLEDEKICRWFYARYKRLKNRPGGSVAKMSEYYDSKKAGFNQALTQTITEHISKGCYASCNFKYDLFEEAYAALGETNQVVEFWMRAVREHEEKLIYSVLKMVRGLAKQYGSEIYGIDEKDLVQAGNEALLKTVRLYKPNSNCRFSTFAHWKIKSAIQQYIMQNSRLVYLPKHKVSNVLLVLQASNLVDEPFRHDIGVLTSECKKLNSSILESEVEEALLHLSGHSLTIDSPLGIRPKSLSDSISDENVDIEGTVHKSRVLDLTEDEILNSLSEMEAAVIYFRYLDPDYIPKRKVSERPYGEIPEMFRVYRLDPNKYPIKSREHIRGIERRALHKLKMRSIWFWKRYRDDVLVKYLSTPELQTLFTVAIEPKVRGNQRLTWGEAAKLLNRAPREIMNFWRSGLSKIRKNDPEIEGWISG